MNSSKSHMPTVEELLAFDWQGFKLLISNLLAEELSQETVEKFLERWSEAFWEFSDFMMFVRFYSFKDVNAEQNQAVAQKAREEFPEINRLYDQLLSKYGSSQIATKDKAIHKELMHQYHSNFEASDTLAAVEEAQVAVNKLVAKRQLRFEECSYTPRQAREQMSHLQDELKRQELWLILQEEEDSFWKEGFPLCQDLIKTQKDYAKQSGFNSYTEYFGSVNHRRISVTESLAWTDKVFEAFRPIVETFKAAQLKHYDLDVNQPWNRIIYEPVEHSQSVEEAEVKQRITEVLGELHPFCQKVFLEAYRYGTVDLLSREGKNNINYCGFIFRDKQPVIMTQITSFSALGTAFHELAHGVHHRMAAENPENSNYWTTFAENDVCEAIALLFEQLCSDIAGKQGLLDSASYQNILLNSFHRTLRLIESSRRYEHFQQWYFSKDENLDIEAFDAFYTENHKPYFHAPQNKFSQRGWSSPFMFLHPFATIEYIQGTLFQLIILKRAQTSPDFFEKLFELMRQGRRIDFDLFSESLGVTDIFSDESLKEAIMSFEEIYASLLI